MEVDEADDELAAELKDEGALHVLEELEDQEEEVAVRTVDGDHAGDVEDEGMEDGLPFSLEDVVLWVEDTSLDGPFWLGADEDEENVGAEDVASVED